VILSEALTALYSIRRPGEIIDLRFKWKREKYDALKLEGLRKH